MKRYFCNLSACFILLILTLPLCGYDAALNERLQALREKNKKETVHERLERLRQREQKQKELQINEPAPTVAPQPPVEDPEPAPTALQEQTTDELITASNPEQDLESTLASTPESPSLQPTSQSSEPPKPSIAQQIAKPKPRPHVTPLPAETKPREKQKPQRPQIQTKPVEQAQQPAPLQPAPKPQKPAQATQAPVVEQTVNLVSTARTEQEERKISLKLFSVIMPLLANYTKDRLFGKTLENNTITNQKNTVKSISTFIKRLRDKLHKLEKKSYYEYMKSPQFKEQQWSSELFERMQMIVSFCKERIKQYNAKSDQPDSVQTLHEQYTVILEQLMHLYKTYF